MRTFVGLIAVAGLVGLASTAEARGPRGGNVVGPDGVLYNTNSPEWRSSGGNMIVYQQIIQQKMFLQQQQMMIKQQQQFDKMQKLQAKGKATGFNGSTLNGGINNGTPFVPDFGGTKAKKRRRTYDPTHPVNGKAPEVKPTESTSKPTVGAPAAPKSPTPSPAVEKTPPGTDNP